MAPGNSVRSRTHCFPCTSNPPHPPGRRQGHSGRHGMRPGSLWQQRDGQDKLLTSPEPWGCSRQFEPRGTMQPWRPQLGPADQPRLATIPITAHNS